ncbi:SV2A [Cordylochernes scorpioides]|uniref:SV2A n=1 Tax=Cordylochernes scorpioides TaxID=51811 RepID=A0ABY6K036_9ARAC|nr:SV2A [Cordylochernes scorpioides]
MYFKIKTAVQAGLGRFQWRLLAVCAAGAALETAELGSAPLAAPGQQRELCGSAPAGAVGAAMAAGALAWGHLADRLGRRRALLFAMAVQAVFSAVAAAAMPTRGLFLALRLCSGFGAGGALPVVVIYWCEFLARKQRGLHFGWLFIFWALGGVSVAGLAWALLPKTGMSMLDMKKPHFSSWRVYLLAMALPVLLAAGALVFLPESPRFLMEVERDNEAVYIYQQIFNTNLTSPVGSDYQLTDVEMPPRPINPLPPPSSSTCKRSMLKALGTIIERCWSSSFKILGARYCRDTVFLGLVWFLTSAGLYGGWAWLPARQSQLASLDYDERAIRRSGLEIHDAVFTGTLENTHFVESTFINVTFERLLLSHCTFRQCVFIHCFFSDVHSSRTLFITSQFEDTSFADTDLQMHKFPGCVFNDSRFASTHAGCEADFDINLRLSPAILIYLTLYLGLVPGVICAALLVDRVGRVRVLMAGCGLAAAAGGLFWTSAPLLALAPLLGATASLSATVLPLLSLEVYSTNVRYSICSSKCR